MKTNKIKMTGEKRKECMLIDKIKTDEENRDLVKSRFQKGLIPVKEDEIKEKKEKTYKDIKKKYHLLNLLGIEVF